MPPPLFGLAFESRHFALRFLVGLIQFGFCPLSLPRECGHGDPLLHFLIPLPGGGLAAGRRRQDGLPLNACFALLSSVGQLVNVKRPICLVVTGRAMVHRHSYGPASS